MQRGRVCLQGAQITICVTLDKVVALEPSQKRAHLLKAKVYEGDNKLEQAAAAYGAACDLGDQKACLKSR